MNSISPNLNLMIKACEKASKVIIRDFGELENLQVSRKGPKDFVTKTDKRVEKILIEELDKTKKDYSFITEETGEDNQQKKKHFLDNRPYRWYLKFLTWCATFCNIYSITKG